MKDESPIFSREVLQFLREHVDTIEKLEILMLLRSHPNLTWDVESLSGELKVAESLVIDVVSELRESGLLDEDTSRTQRLRYKPKTAVLENSMDKLARAYDEDRILVMKVMTSNAIDRMRGSVAQAFADSFRWRPGPKKGKTDG